MIDNKKYEEWIIDILKKSSAMNQSSAWCPAFAYQL